MRNKLLLLMLSQSRANSLFQEGLTCQICGRVCLMADVWLLPLFFQPAIREIKLTIIWLGQCDYIKNVHSRCSTSLLSKKQDYFHLLKQKHKMACTHILNQDFRILFHICPTLFSSQRMQNYEIK